MEETGTNISDKNTIVQDILKDIISPSLPCIGWVKVYHEEIKNSK